MMNRVSQLVQQSLVVILFTGLASSVVADEASDGWLQNWWSEPLRVNANGYGWLPDAPADIRVKDESIGLPESTGTILDDLNAAMMAEFELHKGRVGLFVSPIYYDGTDKEHFTDFLGEDRRLELKERVWLVDYGASFDAVTWDLGESGKSPVLTLAPYFGARYFHDNLRMFVDPGLVSPGVNFQTTIEFNTPFVGMESNLKMNERWSLQARGDTGVWDDSEVEKTWQWSAVLFRHFKIRSQRASWLLGYRYLKLELENSEIAIDVEIKGPLIGFGMEFGG